MKRRVLGKVKLHVVPHVLKRSVELQGDESRASTMHCNGVARTSEYVLYSLRSNDCFNSASVCGAGKLPLYSASHTACMMFSDLFSMSCMTFLHPEDNNA